MQGLASVLLICAAALVAGALLLAALLALQDVWGGWLVTALVLGLMWAPALWVAGGLVASRAAAARAAHRAPAWAAVLGLACPHCGHQAMPWWRKVLLAPGHARPCRPCGQAVSSMALPAVLWLLAPVGMALLSLPVVGALVSSAPAVLGGFFTACSVASILCVHLLRPLEKD